MSTATMGLAVMPDYRVLECAYGPAVRHRDWRVEEGKTRPGGGFLHVFGEPLGRIRRADYLHGGGGDVRIVLSFDVDLVRTDPRAAIHLNAAKKAGNSAGFRVRFQDDRCTIALRGEEVGACAIPRFQRGQRYEVELVTLDREYQVRVLGRVAAAGTLPPPYTDNEGWAVVEAERCDLRLRSFEETFIAVRQPPPAWRRDALLYEETFTAASLRENWVVNTGGAGTGVEVQDGGFVFRHMCNAFVNRRFEGPIAVDCEASPLPTEEFPSGVTDAIFIWMIDAPNEDFAGFLQRRSRGDDAGLGGLMPLPFYWVDLGGTNNVTTRFRRNPHRHLIRQFTDRERLLKRGRRYGITLVQHGHYAEFHVDGSPWIQAYDSQPLSSGYVGFRAYCADLHVNALRVWRLRAP